jgi:hypothetical protein
VNSVYQTERTPVSIFVLSDPNWDALGVPRNAEYGKIHNDIGMPNGFVSTPIVLSFMHSGVTYFQSGIRIKGNEKYLGIDIVNSENAMIEGKTKLEIEQLGTSCKERYNGVCSSILRNYGLEIGEHKIPLYKIVSLQDYTGYIDIDTVPPIGPRRFLSNLAMFISLPL